MAIWSEMSYRRLQQHYSLADEREPDVFDVDEYIEKKLIDRYVYDDMELIDDGFEPTNFCIWD